MNLQQIPTTISNSRWQEVSGRCGTQKFTEKPNACPPKLTCLYQQEVPPARHTDTHTDSTQALILGHTQLHQECFSQGDVSTRDPAPERQGRGTGLPVPHPAQPAEWLLAHTLATLSRSPTVRVTFHSLNSHLSSALPFRDALRLCGAKRPTAETG